MIRMVPTNGVPVTLVQMLASLLPAGLNGLQAFEKSFSSFTGAPHAVSAGSGRAALFAVFKAFAGLHPGCSGVLLPALTCESVYYAVVRAGLQPVLYDLDPVSLSPVPATVAEKTGNTILAAVSSPLFGITFDTAAVAQVVRQKGVFCIEDMAQGLGCTWDGRMLGNDGDVAVYSFGKSKHITTLGGGMVCTGDETINNAVTRLITDWAPPGKLAPLKQRALLAAYKLVIHPFFFKLLTASGAAFADTEFDEKFPLCRSSAWQGRLGNTLLSVFAGIQGQRNAHAAAILNGLAGAPGITPVVPSGPGSSYLRIPVIIDTRQRRDRLAAALIRAGIWAGSSAYRPLYELTGEPADGYPGVSGIHDRILLLPCHPYMNSADVGRLLEVCHNG